MTIYWYFSMSMTRRDATGDDDRKIGWFDRIRVSLTRLAFYFAISLLSRNLSSLVVLWSRGLVVLWACGVVKGQGNSKGMARNGRRARK